MCSVSMVRIRMKIFSFPTMPPVGFVLFSHVYEAELTMLTAQNEAMY